MLGISLFLVASTSPWPLACQPDELRYIGSQDVLALKERVIEHILSSERERDVKAAIPATVDPLRQAVREELRAAMNRGTVDRELAKEAMRFLNQPTGRFAVTRLRAALRDWKRTNDDRTLLAVTLALAKDFGKVAARKQHVTFPTGREKLELVCFKYVSS